MYCPHCGTGASPDARYCAKCGKPLAGGVAAQPSPPKRRHLRLVLFIAVPIIVLAAAGVGAYLGLRGSDSARDASGGAHSLVSIIQDAGRNTWTKLTPSGSPPL